MRYCRQTRQSVIIKLGVTLMALWGGVGAESTVYTHSVYGTKHRDAAGSVVNFLLNLTDEVGSSKIYCNDCTGLGRERAYVCKQPSSRTHAVSGVG